MANKNSKRVAAGRRNRKKRGALTQQAIQRLREAADENRPWQFATGPQTAEGKVRSAANSAKTRKPYFESTQIIQTAKGILSDLSKMKRHSYIDPESATLKDGEELSELLRDIIFDGSSAISRSLVADLLDQAKVAE